MDDLAFDIIDTDSEDTGQRVRDLIEKTSAELTEFIDSRVPITLSNQAYAETTAALLISLNRQLARCAAAFGEANGREPGEISEMIGHQFARNYATALAATLSSAGRTVQ